MPATSFTDPGSRLYGEQLIKIAAQSPDGRLADGVMLVDQDGKPALSESGAVLIGSAQDKFYTQFFNFDTVIDWEVISAASLSGTGAFSPGPAAGMTITGPLGGAAAASTPYINVATGLNSGAATLILCRDQDSGAPLIVRPPLQIRVALTMSQRLAASEVLVGFFECDPVTGELRRGSTYSTVDSLLNIRNVAALRLDGATATQANPVYRAAESGLFAAGATSFTGFTTTATGTGPNFSAPDEIIIDFERDALVFRTVDLNSPTATSTIIRRSDAVPDPLAYYRAGVIILNNAVPASSTDVRLHMFNLLDSTRVDVSPRRTAADLQTAQPVAQVGAINAVGAAAHDAAVSGNPLLLAAEARASNPAAVSAGGDTVRLIATMIGALVVKQHALQEATWNNSVSVTSTTDVPLQSAAGAGLRRHLVGLYAINTGAAAVTLNLRDGTTTRLPLLLPPNIPVPLDLAGLMTVSANTVLNLNLSATGTVTVTAWGYTAP
jgi:hypothetical protein